MRLIAALLAAGLGAACTPTIHVVYDEPARLHFGGVHTVSVQQQVGDPGLVTFLDPLAALTRTSVLSDVAEYLEHQLAAAQVYQVLAGCRAPCQGVDGRFEVEMSSSGIERGAFAGGDKAGTETTASATVIVRLFNPDGSSRFQDKYVGAVNLGVPTADAPPPGDRELVRLAAFAAIDDFVRDLMPRRGRVAFELEDEGPLKPGVDLAIKGDLVGAQAAFQALVNESPNNAAALYDLGAVLTASGNLEAAQEAFFNAARLDSKYVDAAAGASRRLDLREAVRNQNAW